MSSCVGWAHSPAACAVDVLNLRHPLRVGVFDSATASRSEAVTPLRMTLLLFAVATGRLILRDGGLLLFQQFDALGKSQVCGHGMEVTVDLG